MHCHATNLIALTYVLENDTRSSLANCGKAAPSVWWYSRWRWHFAVDGARHGRNRPGDRQEMQKHSLVLWPFHGVFGSDRRWMKPSV